MKQFKFIIKNLTPIPETIVELFRGIPELSSLAFKLPTVLLGFFGRSFPAVISIEEIHLHKISNLNESRHLVGMSEAKQIAEHWGDGNFIMIDPSLIRSFIIDLDKSYRQNQLVYPGRMSKELEHVALAIPFCCVKSLMLNGKEISNPFYLNISEQDKFTAQKVFHAIYREYLNLFANKYSDTNNSAELNANMLHFIQNYIHFYEQFAKEKNPFAMSSMQLKNTFPVFMDLFLSENPNFNLEKSTMLSFFGSTPTLKSFALKEAPQVLDQHFYMQDYQKTMRSHRAPNMTCYEDPYAAFYE